MGTKLQLGVGDDAAYLLLINSQMEQALRIIGGLSTTPVEVPTVSLLDQARALISGSELINFTG